MAQWGTTSEELEVAGPAAFGRALDELADLRREYGFQVLAICGYDWGRMDSMRSAVQARGFPLTDLGERIAEYLLDDGLDPASARDYKDSPLVVGSHNSHPSAHQHGMYADAILAEMERQGMLGARESDR